MKKQTESVFIAKLEQVQNKINSKLECIADYKLSFDRYLNDTYGKLVIFNDIYTASYALKTFDAIKYGIAMCDWAHSLSRDDKLSMLDYDDELRDLVDEEKRLLNKLVKVE